MSLLFSIILPTYNRSFFLLRAIHSVLQQTFSDFELIIIDDHSTDNTKQIINQFSDTRIKTVYQKQNQGISLARNTGIQAAKGEYICFLDDDDELLPEYLQEISKFLKKKKTFIGLIWPGIAKVNAPKNIKNKKEIINTTVFNLGNKKNPAFLRQALFSGIIIHHRCFQKVGVFNPQLQLREDADLIFRMLAAGLNYTSIPKVLIKIHRHEEVSLSRRVSVKDTIKNLEFFLFTHDKFLSENLSLWLYFYSSLAGDYYRIGKKHLGRRLARSISKKRRYYFRIWEIFLRFEFKSLQSKLKTIL